MASDCTLVGMLDKGAAPALIPPTSVAPKNREAKIAVFPDFIILNSPASTHKIIQPECTWTRVGQMHFSFAQNEEKTKFVER
jgi:hypothetical protein